MTIKNDLSEGVMVIVREADESTRAVTAAGIQAGIPTFASVSGFVNIETVGKSDTALDQRYIGPNSDTTFEVTNGKHQIVRVQTETKTVFEGRRIVGGRTRTLHVLPKHVPP